MMILWTGFSLQMKIGIKKKQKKYYVDNKTREKILMTNFDLICMFYFKYKINCKAFDIENEIEDKNAY